MNAEISETMGARLLRFAVQIPELLTQRKFVSVENRTFTSSSFDTHVSQLNCAGDK